MNVMKHPHVGEFFRQIRMGQDAARAATIRQSEAILGQHLRALGENRYVPVMVVTLFDVLVLTEEHHVAIATAVARVMGPCARSRSHSGSISKAECRRRARIACESFLRMRRGANGGRSGCPLPGPR
jgi:hypothetical protein